MRITDKRMSKGARYLITKTIIKEEVLPLIDDTKVRQYAESNLRELTNWAIGKAESQDEEITIDWLYDTIYHFVTYKRPDMAKDFNVDPNYEQDLDDGNMGAYEDCQMGHKKDKVEEAIGKTTEEMIKETQKMSKVLAKAINQPKIEKTIEYVVSQVTVNPKAKEIIEIQVATFIRLQDAKDFIARKEDEIANTILLNKNRFYKIDTRIVKKMSN